jgi:hypothetical protein
MRHSTIHLSAAALALLTARAPAQTTVDLMPMPPALETRFALSALPPHLRGDATVHLLDPARGYVVARPGTNGFSCIVVRTEGERPRFRDDIYTPVCYDAEGSKHQLRVFLDVAQLRAEGWSADRIRAEVADRFKRGTYRAPERTGVLYMVAPMMRAYASPMDTAVVTMSLPHHMFYAPNLTNKDIGGAPPPSPYPFIFDQGPHGYIVTLVGDTERAGIVAASQDLLKDLCAFRSVLCLAAGATSH